ncbi:hypothetical protein PIB30_020508 [Stylosanthes scabra]|uniref:Uncharacterized protein n=1 Tax=Stylosanthes scabra TaxID=79078 RepID=A0ABU6X8H9_9FABA|nr:hypothetical protein [Stylosanthes scabra]
MLVVFLDQIHSRLKNQIRGTSNAFKYSKIVMVPKLPENRSTRLARLLISDASKTTKSKRCIFGLANQGGFLANSTIVGLLTSPRLVVQTTSRRQFGIRARLGHHLALVKFYLVRGYEFGALLLRSVRVVVSAGRQLRRSG